MVVRKIIQISFSAIALIIFCMSIAFEETISLLLIILAGIILSIAGVINGIFISSPTKRIDPYMPPKDYHRPYAPTTLTPPTTPNPNIPPQEVPVFTCKYCEEIFGTELKLRRHIGMKHFKELEI